MATPMPPPDLAVRAGWGKKFQILPFTRGRGGDLDPAYWSVGRCTPTVLAGNGINPTRPTAIPTAQRASFLGGTRVWPGQDDMIRCDRFSSFNGMLMVSQIFQDYGIHDMMDWRTFDFTGRTGTITWEVDALCVDSLGVYCQIAITDQPCVCLGYQNTSNQEAGPVPKNGIVVALSGSVGSGTNVGVAFVYTYSNYAKTQISSTFELTGSNLPTTQQDVLNHIEVRVSSTNIQIWMSDKSADGNVTFPNLRRIWEGTITAPLTTGYVHYAFRNHAMVKFGHPAYQVSHSKTMSFDGTPGSLPAVYEVADNDNMRMSTDATELDFPYPEIQLGYEISNGSSRTEGLWKASGSNAADFAGAIPFTQHIDLTGKTSAQLILTWFVQSITHAPDTTWGLKYKFNGGTFRTRSLTSAEANNIDGVSGPNPGTSGFIGLVADITFADLVQGRNTLELSTVNVPEDFYSQAANIYLKVV